MRLVLSVITDNYSTSLYGEEWVKNGDHINKSSESLTWIHFLLCLDIKYPFKIWFRSEFPVPVPKKIQAGESAWPGENVSLLWLHIKIQKEISLRVYSNSVKSTTCIQCSTSLLKWGCGAVLGFLGIKSSHVNQKVCPSAPLCRTGQQIYTTHSSNGWFRSISCRCYQSHDAVQCVQKFNTQRVLVLNQPHHPQLVQASKHSTKI